MTFRAAAKYGSNDRVVRHRRSTRIAPLDRNFRPQVRFQARHSPGRPTFSQWRVCLCLCLCAKRPLGVRELQQAACTACIAHCSQRFAQALCHQEKRRPSHNQRCMVAERWSFSRSRASPGSHHGLAGMIGPLVQAQQSQVERRKAQAQQEHRPQFGLDWVKWAQAQTEEIMEEPSGLKFGEGATEVKKCAALLYSQSTGCCTAQANEAASTVSNGNGLEALRDLMKRQEPRTSMSTRGCDGTQLDDGGAKYEALRVVGGTAPWRGLGSHGSCTSRHCQVLTKGLPARPPHISEAGSS